MSIFDFLKRDNNIYAPVKGKCLDIIECEDMVFSSKMMGDGFMILPEEDIICSPANGIVTMIFPTAHAFGIKLNNEQELLIHIGINTVELNGKYFEILGRINQKVKKGDPIIKVNIKEINKLGYNTNIMVACVNQKDVHKKHLNEFVTVDDIIIGG